MESYDAYPPSEDVLLGTPDGRLSPVRRFFCLLATFDFLFTFLLFTLCVILIRGSHSITEALQLQVMSYSLDTSIFDVVMCAGCRFTILILFYALLRSHHWFPVAFTTTSTCCFLLVKIFLFDWSKIDATYPVMLVLSSFILSWSEAWFLDFRVVPQERQAAMYYSRQNSALAGGARGVIPWLGQSVSQIVRNTPVSHSYPESVANFYSPLESPIQSDGENEHSETESMEKKLSKIRSDTPEAKMWLQQGPVIAEELLVRLQENGWVLEKSSEVGDNVFFKKTHHHKIYMISGNLPVSPNSVVTELFHNFESMPNWNPNVIKCQILQKIDAATDVSYQISKSGGPVSSRDFVTLRHYKANSDGTHVLAAVSVKHTLKPPNQPKLTRGTNGIGGWVISACSGEPTRTEFQWLLDVDLRLQGWVPKGMVDNAMVSAALETVKCLRRKLEFLMEDPPPVYQATEAHPSHSSQA